MAPTYNTERGFAVSELITAMCIATIVAFIAVPNVRALSAEYSLMGASSQLGFDIARARMKAIGQNQYVRIRMLNATQYAQETSTDGSSWSNRVTTTLPNGITSSTTSAEVRFDRRGFPAVNNSIIVANGINQTKTVATSLVGRVSIS